MWVDVDVYLWMVKFIHKLALTHYSIPGTKLKTAILIYKKITRIYLTKDSVCNTKANQNLHSVKWTRNWLHTNFI